MNKNDLIILEECNNEFYQAKCLLQILTEYFEHDRFDDITMDWYSLSRMFNEYKEMTYVILNILITSQKKLEKLIDNTYSIDDEEENE